MLKGAGITIERGNGMVKKLALAAIGTGLVVIGLIFVAEAEMMTDRTHR